MKELLIKLNACQPSKDWAADKSWKEIYETCHRGDWLLWLFYKTMNHNSEEDFTLLTRAKGNCANTVRHLMKDQRSTAAVDAAINYSGDKLILKNASAAAAYYAADADCSSAAAAYYASAAAAYYAAAAYSADAAAYFAAKKNNQLATANIVRKFIPIEKWRIDINL